jgi:hypothetical protein
MPFYLHDLSNPANLNKNDGLMRSKPRLTGSVDVKFTGKAESTPLPAPCTEKC